MIQKSLVNLEKRARFSREEGQRTHRVRLVISTAISATARTRKTRVDRRESREQCGASTRACFEKRVDRRPGRK